MNDNEKLIEEAAKAIRGVRTVTFRGEDGYLSVGSADSETIARAALAVFEKAHTPTDDEREALRGEAEKVQRAAWAEIHDAQVERARIIADLREWARPLGNSPEEETLRLVIDRIERSAGGVR